MATTCFVYGQVPLKLMYKLFSDYASGSSTFKAALLTSSYTPSQDNHTSYNDISTYEVTGTNYTAGGATLGNKAVTYASRVTKFDCDDISWANLTLDTAAQYLVIYDDTPSGATNKLLVMCFNFGTTISSTAATLQLNVNSNGLLNYTVAAEA